MRISYWSSDVCSSDLLGHRHVLEGGIGIDQPAAAERIVIEDTGDVEHRPRRLLAAEADARLVEIEARRGAVVAAAHGEVAHRRRRRLGAGERSEERAAGKERGGTSRSRWWA